MRRKLFSLAVMISLLLCMATVTLWLRSYWYIDSYRHGGSSHYLLSLLGRVHLLTDFGTQGGGGESHLYSERLSPQTVWNRGSSGYPPQPQWRFGCIWHSYTRFHMPFGPDD